MEIKIYSLYFLTVFVTRSGRILLPERHRDQRGAHDQEIEQVERRSTECTLVYNETVRDHLQTDLDREYSGEEIVKLLENLRAEG